MDGRKTQTRRVIKDGANRTPQNIGREKFFKMVNALNNKPFFGAGFYKDSDVFEYKGEILTDAVYFKCPYKPGDVLYVKETWAEAREKYYYKADKKCIGFDDYGCLPRNVEYHETCDICEYSDGYIKWRSPRFMPKEAARIFLLVKEVRAERLQEITAEDVIREGIKYSDSGPYHWHVLDTKLNAWINFHFHDEAFKHLWDSLNAKRGYGWDTNPWVWVIEFERVR